MDEESAAAPQRTDGFLILDSGAMPKYRIPRKLCCTR